jgi:hypothetical protein
MPVRPRTLCGAAVAVVMSIGRHPGFAGRVRDEDAPARLATTFCVTVAISSTDLSVFDASRARSISAGPLSAGRARHRFVFLGLLAREGDRATFAMGSLLISLVMSIWILFAHHYRQIYMFKLDRLLELEAVMDAEQNRRFHDGLASKRYRTEGPAGHNLDLSIYVTVSLAAPSLALAAATATWWLLIPVAVTTATAARVLRNEHRVNRALTDGRNLDALKARP